MRKVVFGNAAVPVTDLQPWLDIEALATAELSSEDPAKPFENALSAGGHGWRALAPGPQTIRLRFDTPIDVQKIRLEFLEPEIQRTQEFSVVAEVKGGGRREIVRQQWNFGPGDSSTEKEEYTVDLRNLVYLELNIDPGKHDRTCFATLEFLGLR